MPEVTLQNGDVVDPDEHTPVCHNCQRPKDDVVRAFNGEWYCPECRPDWMKP